MSHESQPNPAGAHLSPVHNQIQKLVGVIGAKGGVGKSLTASLLACGLSRAGKKVGILDADFSGSSIHHLFGLHGPAPVGQYSFMPLQSGTGIKIMSPVLVLEDEEKLVFWNESLAGKLIEDLWKEVEWGELDYLIVDLPPATSGVTISILRALPFDAILVVTAPPRLSTAFNRKSISTVQKKIGLPILGIVENMAYFTNPSTGKREYIFGGGNVSALARTVELPILAQIPLDPEISLRSDSGKIEQIRLEVEDEFIENILEALASLPDNASPVTPRQASSPSSAPSHPVRQGFSDKVVSLIRSKENVGVLDKPDGQGLFKGSCGDRMQIDLGIVAGRIKEARFLADGCGATYACGSMITRMASSMTLEHAQQITAEDLILALDGLPEDHLHCAELAVMTLREAIIDAIEGHCQACT